MPSQIAGSNRCAELQRAKNHEKHSGHNVNQGKNRVVREDVIERVELRQASVGCKCGWPVTMQNDRHNMHRPAQSDSDSDERQETYSNPERPRRRRSDRSVLHTTNTFGRVRVFQEPYKQTNLFGHL